MALPTSIDEVPIGALMLWCPECGAEVPEHECDEHPCHPSEWDVTDRQLGRAFEDEGRKP